MKYNMITCPDCIEADSRNADFRGEIFCKIHNLIYANTIKHSVGLPYELRTDQLNAERVYELEVIKKRYEEFKDIAQVSDEELEKFLADVWG